MVIKCGLNVKSPEPALLSFIHFGAANCADLSVRA